MSDFRDDCVLLDENESTAAADGVRIARRGFLRLSAATVAAALSSSCLSGSGGGAAGAASSATAASPPGLAPGSLDVAQFLAEFHPRAQRFIESRGSEEEAYLAMVQDLLQRLRIPTRDEANGAASTFREEHLAAGGVREIGFVMFEFEPGRGFSHHDHRDYNGVILGVDGTAQVSNYDILGHDPLPPAGATFQIQQTRDDLVLPGQFSTLGTVKDNVHALTAGPEGATLLDVFTYLNPGARSYFLDVEAKARDEERRIFDAAWA